MYTAITTRTTYYCHSCTASAIPYCGAFQIHFQGAFVSLRLEVCARALATAVTVDLQFLHSARLRKADDESDETFHLDEVRSALYSMRICRVMANVLPYD